MTLEGLDINILGPAMVAGVIVLSTHVPLGRQVLSRGIIFIDLAIAQTAALGVIAAQYMGGTLFVLAATGGLLLLANNPQGGEHLKDLLVGQILWVSYRQLIPAALLSAVLLVFLWFRSGRLVGAVFYALFALAITVSVQLVGVYLVFASLIVPALATAGLSGKHQLVAAYSVGILGYLTGLALSAIFDLPSGAMIVWTLAGCALLAQLLPAVRRPAA